MSIETSILCRNGTGSCQHGFCDSSGECICEEGFDHDYSWATIRNCGVDVEKAKWALWLVAIVALFSLVRFGVHRRQFTKLNGMAKQLHWIAILAAVMTIFITIALLVTDLRYSWFSYLAYITFGTAAYYSFGCVLGISIKAVGSLSSKNDIDKYRVMMRRTKIICVLNILISGVFGVAGRAVIDSHYDEDDQVGWMGALVFWNVIVQIFLGYHANSALKQMAASVAWCAEQVEDVNSPTKLRLIDLLKRVNSTRRRLALVVGFFNTSGYIVAGLAILLSKRKIPFSFWIFNSVLVLVPCFYSFMMHDFLIARSSRGLLLNFTMKSSGSKIFSVGSSFKKSHPSNLHQTIS